MTNCEIICLVNNLEGWSEERKSVLAAIIHKGNGKEKPMEG